MVSFLYVFYELLEILYFNDLLKTVAITRNNHEMTEASYQLTFPEYSLTSRNASRVSRS